MSTNRETSYMKRFLQHKKNNNKLTMDHDSFTSNLNRTNANVLQKQSK